MGSHKALPLMYVRRVSARVGYCLCPLAAIMTSLFRRTLWAMCMIFAIICCSLPVLIYIYIYGWPVDLDMVLFAADVESAMLKALDKICASIALFNIHHHIAETALLCPLSGKCQLLQYW